MTSLLLILLSAVLVGYYAATIPALKPFVDVDQFETAVGIALATFVALAIVSPLAYLFEHELLLPLGLAHLSVLGLVIVVLIVAQLVSLLLGRFSRWILRGHAFVVLMTTNCAVLGVALLNTTRVRSFADSLLFGLGTGAAFAITLLMFTAMQQRTRHADIPCVFREAPAALITIGLMALAFMGFAGLVRE
ncbi:MAG TPA: Rnf-Nqr domain containing protein [Steroidobacteraceae bacterium]|jgi:electron transport complex protein RnfA